jgi:hypothetical protein
LDILEGFSGCGAEGGLSKLRTSIGKAAFFAPHDVVEHK